MRGIHPNTALRERGRASHVGIGHHPSRFCMPRYYFKSCDGDRALDDENGIELEGIEQARAMAVLALTELAREILPQARAGRTIKLCVLDGGAAPAFEFRLTFEASARGEFAGAEEPGADR